MKCSDNCDELIVNDEYIGIEEYELNKISSTISSYMDGFGPCGSAFYDGFDLLINEIAE